MRRPFLLAATLLLPLLALVPPGAEGAALTYHRVEADTFGSSQDDFVLALATGRRLLVAGGYASGPIAGQEHQGQTDAVIRVYSRDFTERWTHQIGTPGDDGVAAVATDGRLVVAGGWTDGDLGGPSGGHDPSGWVKVFKPDGTERWSRHFGSGVSGVAVTPDAVFVAGRASGRGRIKAYARGGRLLWSKKMTSYMTPTVTHLAASGDHVFYASGYTPIDSLHRTYVGALDARTGDSEWYRLHSTDGDQITALTAGAGRVYVSSTTAGGIIAYRARDGRDLWSSREVTIPHGERMRFAVAISRADDVIVAAFVGFETTALVALSPRGRVQHVQRLRQIWPTSVVRRQHSVFVGGYTKAGLDGDPAGGWDGAVARYVP